MKVKQDTKVETKDNGLLWCALVLLYPLPTTTNQSGNMFDVFISAAAAPHNFWTKYINASQKGGGNRWLTIAILSIVTAAGVSCPFCPLMTPIPFQHGRWSHYQHLIMHRPTILYSWA